MITAISVLAIAAGLFLIAAVVFACLYFREKGKNTAGEQYAEGVKISGGVRYSKDGAVFDNDGANISLQKGDFVLEKGQTYIAETNGALLAGKYTVLAASRGSDPVKLRVGGIVRDFYHGDTVVLADGEEICSVSRTAILR